MSYIKYFSNQKYNFDVSIFVVLQIVHGAFIEPHHVMKKRSIDQPLRIVLYYDESVHK